MIDCTSFAGLARCGVALQLQGWYVTGGRIDGKGLIVVELWNSRADHEEAYGDRQDRQDVSGWVLGGCLQRLKQGFVPSCSHECHFSKPVAPNGNFARLACSRGAGVGCPTSMNHPRAPTDPVLPVLPVLASSSPVPHTTTTPTNRPINPWTTARRGSATNF